MARYPAGRAPARPTVPLADDPMADHPVRHPLQPMRATCRRQPGTGPADRLPRPGRCPTPIPAGPRHGRPPGRYPAGQRPLAAPLADDPMADRPADSRWPASRSPVCRRKLSLRPVPVPSAVSAAPPDDGAQAATGSWSAYPSAERTPTRPRLGRGRAAYPDEDDSAGPAGPAWLLRPAGRRPGRHRARGRHRRPGGAAAAGADPEIFCELADLASIPRAAYALETETDGAICLLPTPDGFDVFIAADGARHELRSFAEEEAAYFYLFGVLAADAVRSGALALHRHHGQPARRHGIWRAGDPGGSSQGTAAARTGDATSAAAAVRGRGRPLNCGIRHTSEPETVPASVMDRMPEVVSWADGSRISPTYQTWADIVQ